MAELWGLAAVLVTVAGGVVHELIALRRRRARDEPDRRRAVAVTVTVTIVERHGTGARVEMAVGNATDTQGLALTGSPDDAAG